MTSLKVDQVVAQVTLLVTIGYLPDGLVIEDSRGHLQDFCRVAVAVGHCPNLLGREPRVLLQDPDITTLLRDNYHNRLATLVLPGDRVKGAFPVIDVKVLRMLQVGILFSHLGRLSFGCRPRLVTNRVDAPAEQKDHQNGNDNVSKCSQG